MYQDARDALKITSILVRALFLRGVDAVCDGFCQARKQRKQCNETKN